MNALWSELRGFWSMTRRRIKQDSGASEFSFRYSAAVFSISIPVKPGWCVGFLFLAGCTTLTGGAKGEAPASPEFYTLTAEIALSRGQLHVAALQYAAAARLTSDPKLLQRAAEVGADTMQPSLVATVALRWIEAEPKSPEADRAAARAALQLYKIDDASMHYRSAVTKTPSGVDAAFAELENDLTGDENTFGAHALADQLAESFPSSTAAMRVQGLSALRADDPAAAVRALTLALGGAGTDSPCETESAAATDAARRALLQTLLRARIMAGDIEAPLAQARALIECKDDAPNRFDYVVLLMTAQRDDAAADELERLAAKPESKSAALRLLGLLAFQHGRFDAADARFNQLLRTGQFQDDAFYYLAVIADRNGESERALRLYSQVQHGDNVVPALLRASSILYAHGAPAAADELLDRLSEDEPERAPEVINTRARIYADGGQLPKAYAVLQKGLEEFPDSVELRYTRASIDEDGGKTSDAIHELASVLKDRPQDPAAMNALGFTLADHRRSLAKARKLIERAHTAAPRNPAILDSLGWVLFRQGHDAEALPYLWMAYKDDRSGDIAAHLGEVLWRQGSRDEAQRIWSEAFVMDADNKLLKSTRRRLQGSR